MEFLTGTGDQLLPERSAIGVRSPSEFRRTSSVTADDSVARSLCDRIAERCD